MEISPRKEKILSSVVQGFVASGEPVGSKAIAEAIGVSSATVRSDMADLIELGLLEQPHTSAGRVPSQRGYREYVDRLMEVPVLSDAERRYFDSALTAGSFDAEQLLQRSGRLLAGVTRCASVVTTPSGAQARVQAVQLVQTGRRTAMLILMSSAGTMKSRVFHCDYDLTSEMLRIFFRAFNQRVTGREVGEITPAFLQTMGVSLGEMYMLAAPALQALYETARETLQTEVILDGQMNLLFYGELEHRQVIGFLERREELAALLAQKPGRVIAMIGREAGYGELRDVSLLISRYTVGGQDAGALAVLGPTRVDYARITAILEYLTGAVSRMLTLLLREA